MSQNDFNLANQGFPSMRSDINSALQALASNSSGATAPSTPYAYQYWYDTTTNILKMRNAANSAWINIFTFDQGAGTWSANAGNLTVGGSQVYYRSNIVGASGTATQSGGVPTGVIIERDSNANGEYVKFADGTLICTRDVVVNHTSTGTQNFTWPVAFSSGVLSVAIRFSPTSTLARIDRFNNCHGQGNSTNAIFVIGTGGTAAESLTHTMSGIGRWY